jgi:hypothetical protein
MTKVPFDVAVEALRKADFVLIQDEDGNQAVATFVGFDEEGNEDSVFTIGSEELWDLDLLPSEDVTLTDDKTGFLIEDHLVMPVYKKEIA